MSRKAMQSRRYNDSLMLQLLSHKMQHPEENKQVWGDYFPEKDLTCAENGGELGSFLEEHPNRGMPFGFPPLTEDEFSSLPDGWPRVRIGPSPEQAAADDAAVARRSSLRLTSGRNS